jgi:single-strand DNA-binding protein
VNNCSFVGCVGKDAVTRVTGTGKPVTGWSLAIDTGWGDKKTTTWLDCTLWGERGEKLADKILKGDRLGVVGELGTREHDGKTYVTLDVRDVTLLGNKPTASADEGRGHKPSAKPQAARGVAVPARDDDDSDPIPF